MRLCLLALLTLASVVLAGEPTPRPEVRLTVNGAVMQDGAKISGQPGEKLLLKNQALSIKKMSELREFYLQRAADFVDESRKIHADMDKNKPVEVLDARARALLSGTAFAKWRASPGVTVTGR